MILYKYMSMDRFEKHIIQKPTIRFTPSDAFNDPFEFFPAIQGYKDIDKQKKRLDEMYDQVLLGEIKKLPLHYRSQAIHLGKSLKNNITKNVLGASLDLISQKIFYECIFQKIGVFCVTSDNLNILMWSHYASEHKGVTISFDENDSFFKIIPGILGEFKKVLYKETRPLEYAEDMVNLDLFYTKSLLWSYEQEYRLIAPLTEKIKYNWIDMKKGICEIPKSSIKGVTFGCKCPNDQIEMWRDKLTAEGGYEHLKFHKVTMDNYAYKLNIQDLI